MYHALSGGHSIRTWKKFFHALRAKGVFLRFRTAYTISFHLFETSCLLHVVIFSGYVLSRVEHSLLILSRS